jgi:hypothetical protein
VAFEITRLNRTRMTSMRVARQQVSLHFFSCAVGGNNPFRRRYIAAAP